MTVQCGKKVNFLKASVTVELSYLLPILFLLFLLIIYTTFYYHDKNILIGAAQETAVLGVQLERKPDENGQTDLCEFCQGRIAGKLILFSGAQTQVEMGRTGIEVTILAQRGDMKIRAVQKAVFSAPEKSVRLKRNLEKIAGQEE